MTHDITFKNCYVNGNTKNEFNIKEVQLLKAIDFVDLFLSLHADPISSGSDFIKYLSWRVGTCNMSNCSTVHLRSWLNFFSKWYFKTP